MIGKPKALTALALIAVLAAAGCDRSATSERPPEAGDRAVAKVGDHTIWTSDVKREAVTQGLISEGEPLDASSSMFQQVLDSLVDERLLAAESLKRKLDQDPVAQRRLAAARERILADLLVEKAVEKASNENAIRGLYQEQLKLTRQVEQFKVRQIVTNTQAEGEAVRRLLQSGASFDALAMERSIDTATRFSGGLLDYFNLDLMPEAYGTALKDAKAGQVVGPFRAEAGFVVLKVEDRRLEPPISLEDARPQIVRFLSYDEVRELLETLRKGARVRMLTPPAADMPGAPREPDSAPDLPLAPGASAPPPAAPATTAPAPAPKAAAPAPKAAQPAAKP